MIAVYLIDVSPWNLPQPLWLRFADDYADPPIDAVEVAPYFADEVTL